MAHVAISGRLARLVGTGFVLALALLSGCSRTHYRASADNDAYSILAEKTAARPWQVPCGYDVLPHPLARFRDPTPVEDPWLPMPAPQLYAYALPPLPPRQQFTGDAYGSGRPENAAAPGLMFPGTTLQRLPPVEASGLPRTARSYTGKVSVRPASFLISPQQALRRGAGDRPGGSARMPKYLRESLQEFEMAEELRVQPLPKERWDVLPHSCLRRMFEFESARDEYEFTYGRQPSEQFADAAPRLTLEDIVYLASINSREYQTQKETLYRAALRLSLERFDYALKFSTSGNRMAANYDHTWVDGTSDSQLSVPASLQADKLLVTGGDFLARFANSVVMTFNGPQGFAADITSDLLFDVSQTIFQRDVRLERLTQAERNVVYAARNFARFRKTLFTQLASAYYALIRTYRQVEISSLSYFQLVRAFGQSAAEYKYQVGGRSRVQVDQVEQSVLNSRSSLISTCNALEVALDNLKIRMGLPTETAVNIDLTELRELTRRDELAVTGALVGRSRRLLQEELDPNQRVTETPDQDLLLNTSVLLLGRMLRAMELKAQLGEEQVDPRPLRVWRSRLSIQSKRSKLRLMKEEEASARQRQGVSLEPTLFGRTLDAYDKLTDAQLDLLELTADVRGLRSRADELRSESEVLLAEMEGVVEGQEIGRNLLTRAGRIRDGWEQLVTEADALIAAPPEPATPEEQLAQTVDEVLRLIQESERLLGSIRNTLTPVEIATDDAMLTALVLRLDLMNEREALADDWRQIKLAADDLKSVLNLDASQTLRSTRRLHQGPADTTTDSAQTQVRITFDAPLNRRSQRNAYRTALIDYNVALRSLMQLEDTVKLGVRNDLRALSLTREQYAIDVASAGLARERVVSTTVELQVGLATVQTRDYLEAQSAYIQSLSGVATRHINYITDRMQLFLDLELLTVGEDNFWPGLRDEKLQPSPCYQLPPYALPAYGQLPRVWHSKEIRRMCEVPTGVSMLPSGLRGGGAEGPQAPAPPGNGGPPPEFLPPPVPQPGPANR